jgi:hypothetical protein
MLANLPTATVAHTLSFLNLPDGVWASRACAATKEAHDALLGDASSLVLKHAPEESADELCLQFVSRSPRLRSLHLTGVSLRPETFVNIAQACPELETLTLDCSWGFGDAHLLAVAANFNNLRTLAMQEVTANAEAMATVASTPAWLPKLEKVHFSSQSMAPGEGSSPEFWGEDHDGEELGDLFKGTVAFSYQPCPNINSHHQCSDCEGYLIWNDPPSHLVRSDCDEHGQPVRKWCVCEDSCKWCTKKNKFDSNGQEAHTFLYNDNGDVIDYAPLHPNLICDCRSWPIYEIKYAYG